MRVVIAGGHGKVALLLERLLAGRGDQAVGLIRNPAQAADVQNAGADAVVCDLEAASADDVAVLLSWADAVVFAGRRRRGRWRASQGFVRPGCLRPDGRRRRAGRGGRFVQISSIGAGQPPQPGTGEVWTASTAKTAAEDDLRSRDLDWTILRPGHLTDAPATGKIRLAAPPSPPAPSPAPTSPRSSPPCSMSRVPCTRRLS